jgi:Pescadillo N-terminus
MFLVISCYLQVDVRVMITFLEFYEVFMKFVLFKLYHTQGLRYPPTEDQQLKEAGCFLLAIKPTQIDAAVGADASSTGSMGMIDAKEQCKDS